MLDRIDEQEGVEDRSLPVPVAAPHLSAAYEMKSTQNGSQPVRGIRNIFTWDGFKTFAILFSFVVNIVLVVIVFVLSTSVFKIKSDIADPLVGGLHDNFVALDQATIRTTIPVETTISVSDKVTADFDLALQQETIVTLTQPTVIRGASVTIDGGILQINNAPTTIVLPAGTQLPIALDLSISVIQDIPVELQIPVSIPVDVDIPLEQTELHDPFTNLRDLFAPYNDLLQSAPNSWAELINPNANP